MSQELATRESAQVMHGEIMEQVIARGDLSKLSPADRSRYYMAVCESIGVNPLTKPFDYIALNGKLTLYALKTCTDQLRMLHGVSVLSVEKDRTPEHQIVTVRVRDKHGRTDEATGIVTIAGKRGDDLANALMKAETKAKRRATLSICGLGWLDETELETIPQQKVVNPETGRLINPQSSRQAGKRGEWDGTTRTDGNADDKPFNHDNLVDNMRDCASAVSLQRLWDDYKANTYPKWPRKWIEEAETLFSQAMAEHTAAAPEETFADAVAEWDSDGVVWPETRAEYVQQCHDIIERYDSKIGLLTWWNSVEQKAARRRYSLNEAELRELMGRVTDRAAELAEAA